MARSLKTQVKSLFLLPCLWPDILNLLLEPLCRVSWVSFQQLCRHSQADVIAGILFYLNKVLQHALLLLIIYLICLSIFLLCFLLF